MRISYENIQPHDRSGDFNHVSYLSVIIRYARIIEQTVLSCGITSTQYRILFRLMGRHDSLRIGQLADALDLGASAVTGAIAQLAEAGAVIRTSNEQDRRAVHVLTTEYGRHLVQKADGALRFVLEDIRNDFPPDLRRYASICTLEVARRHSLFGEKEALRNVNAALCEEILLTYTLINHITRDEGLCLTEYRVLLDLFNHTEGSHPNEVACRLGVKRNSIAAVQTELLRRSFIVRERDPLDRRAVLMDITCDGYRVLQRTAIAVDAGLHTQLLPHMTSDDLIKHRRLADEALRIRRDRGAVRAGRISSGYASFPPGSSVR